tara:strand:+ start:126 stop:575 length:450 start_codon:yes stop_codon:yes gene_type:complete
MADTSVEEEKLLTLVNDDESLSKKDKATIGKILRTEGLKKAKEARILIKFDKPTSGNITDLGTVTYTGKKPIPKPKPENRTKEKEGGKQQLDPIPKGDAGKGLTMLSPEVRNKMGFMKKGGSAKKQYGYMGGGKVYPQPRTARRPMSGE